MTNSFTLGFTAGPGHIDENGHVNNMVWLEWVQEIAYAHWYAVATAEQAERYVWFVTRHEIDYRGNIGPGETVTAHTFIPDPPSGARFVRGVDFTNEAGKLLVQVRSTWAMIDRASGRAQRITPEISGPFMTGT